MPKERIASVSGYMDPMVCWGPDEMQERGRPVVRLFAYPAQEGSLMFRPDHPQAMGLNEGDSVGPVYALLDEVAIDHLIRALKRAKRHVFTAESRLPRAT